MDDLGLAAGMGPGLPPGLLTGLPPVIGDPTSGRPPDVATDASPGPSRGVPPGLSVSVAPARRVVREVDRLVREQMGWQPAQPYVPRHAPNADEAAPGVPAGPLSLRRALGQRRRGKDEAIVVVAGDDGPAALPATPPALPATQPPTLAATQPDAPLMSPELLSPELPSPELPSPELPSPEPLVYAPVIPEAPCVEPSRDAAPQMAPLLTRAARRELERAAQQERRRAPSLGWLPAAGAVLLGFLVVVGLLAVSTGQLARLSGVVALAAGGMLLERAWRGLLRPGRSSRSPRSAWGRMPWVPIGAMAVGLVLAVLHDAA